MAEHSIEYNKAGRPYDTATGKLVKPETAQGVKVYEEWRATPEAESAMGDSSIDREQKPKTPDEQALEDLQIILDTLPEGVTGPMEQELRDLIRNIKDVLNEGSQEKPYSEGHTVRAIPGVVTVETQEGDNMDAAPTPDGGLSAPSILPKGDWVFAGTPHNEEPESRGSAEAQSVDPVSTDTSAPDQASEIPSSPTDPASEDLVDPGGAIEEIETLHGADEDSSSSPSFEDATTERIPVVMDDTRVFSLDRMPKKGPNRLGKVLRRIGDVASRVVGVLRRPARPVSEAIERDTTPRESSAGDYTDEDFSRWSGEDDEDFTTRLRRIKEIQESLDTLEGPNQSSPSAADQRLALELELTGLTGPDKSVSFFDHLTDGQLAEVAPGVWEGETVERYDARLGHLLSLKKEQDRLKGEIIQSMKDPQKVKQLEAELIELELEINYVSTGAIPEITRSSLPQLEPPITEAGLQLSGPRSVPQLDPPPIRLEQENQGDDGNNEKNID